MALIGSNFQVSITVDAQVKALDAAGNIVPSPGYTFPTLADATAALSTAVANGTGTVSLVKITNAGGRINPGP